MFCQITHYAQWEDIWASTELTCIASSTRRVFRDIPSVRNSTEIPNTLHIDAEIEQKTPVDSLGFALLFGHGHGLVAGIS
ncbi:hypothetical protein TNCV_4572401 [Trichonephila clavipes]|nr:hypothetical protein TNCV_4572401 [Trichonephila clavipes]